MKLWQITLSADGGKTDRCIITAGTLAAALAKAARKYVKDETLRWRITVVPAEEGLLPLSEES